MQEGGRIWALLRTLSGGPDLLNIYVIPTIGFRLIHTQMFKIGPESDVMLFTSRHRLSAGVLLVLACLWSATAFANMAIPYFFIVLSYAWMLLIPVIVIEAIVIKRRLSQPFSDSLGMSAVVNVISAILGVVVLFVLSMVLAEVGFEMLSGWPAKLPFFLALVPSYFVTVWVEARVAITLPIFKSYAFPEMFKVFVVANLYSYALLGMLSIAITTPRY